VGQASIAPAAQRSLLIESKLVIGRAYISTDGASYRSSIRFQPFGESPVNANVYKQSGVGREHGRVAVEMYTETKSVCMLV
jgi:acyl-CoA reductase-like NAD-dependent aldehyde dehydrogenase